MAIQTTPLESIRSRFFGGTPTGVSQLPRFSPEQQAAQSQLLQQGLQGFNPEALEQRARRQFSEQTIPSIAERFTSLGGGAQRSSAFEGALGRAGAGLEEGLAGQRSQMGLQQLGLGLTPQFESLISPRQAGTGEQLLGGGLQALMSLLPQLLQLLGGGS